MARPVVERTCERCGSRFLARSTDVARGRGRFCCVGCARASQRWRATATCGHCGVAFLTRPADIARGRGRYCSPSCRQAARRTRETRICANPACGKQFLVVQSTIARGFGHYCAQACYHAVRWGRAQAPIRICATCGAEIHGWRMPRESGRYYCAMACFYARGHRTSQCLQCGQTFSHRPGERKRAYCSNRCVGLALRRPRVARRCEICAQEFSATAPKVEKGWARYCSNTCRLVARRRGRYLQCNRDGCRRIFWVLPSQVHRRFCSRNCYLRTIAPFQHVCLGCRRPFQVKKWRRAKVRYCSITCSNRYRWREGQHPRTGPAPEPERNQFIMENRAQGLSSSAIENLLRERTGWWLPAASVRKVISRESARRGLVAHT